MVRNSPRSFILTAELDPLRDDGEMYGLRLSALGVYATTKRYIGVVHAFFVMPSVTQVAGDAIRDPAAPLGTCIAWSK